MKNFRIVPLAIEYIRRIKETLIDDFGHEVKTQLAYWPWSLQGIIATF